MDQTLLSVIKKNNWKKDSIGGTTLMQNIYLNKIIINLKPLFFIE